MKRLKKVLSLVLVLCMVLTCTTSAFAEGTDAYEPIQGESVDITSEDDSILPTEEGISDTDSSVIEDAAVNTVSDSNDEVEIETEIDEDEVTTEDTVALASIITGTKPADGTTSGQPFNGGTAGSTNFRIPAMVTLNSGRIVTAADARWNSTGDGGGNDTLVSYSDDNGSTWHYTMANYLGDNGNTHNDGSTCFIDPSLATDGSTVYMLVDLWPGGYALNSANDTPVAGANGFDSNGNLRLSKDNRSSYGYYLSNGKIYSNDGTEQTGYSVDAYYNITGNGYNTNLFCTDSPFVVYPTDYLYLTKSTDGGATWGAPSLINVKYAYEQSCLVGPGTGIVTSTGRIIFTVYNYTSGDKNSSVIYSDDNGATWTRSADVNATSSEATLCEVNGTLYMFTRHGGYYTSTDNGSTWSSQKSVSGISYNTGCELNVLKYSKTIDGKPAILLSAAGSTSSRSNGKIFVGLIQDNGSINWAYTYSVNNGTFQYSCLTELNDGSIGILYENGSASIKYEKLDIATVAKNAVIGTDEPATDPVYEMTDASSSVKVSTANNTEKTALTALTVSSATVDSITTDYVAYDVTINNGSYTGAAEVTLPLSDAIQAADSITAFVVEDGAVKEISGGTKSSDGKSFTFTAPHFSVVGVMAKAAEEEDETVPDSYKGTISQGSGAVYYVLDTDGVDAGEQYLIVSGNSGTAYALNSSGSRVSVSISSSKITSLSDATAVFTIEKNGSGYNLKDSAGTYLYPYASRNVMSWSYSISSKQSSAKAVTISGTTSVTIGIDYTYSGWGTYNTTSYITYSSNKFSGNSSSSNLYLFKKVTEPSGYVTDLTKLQEQITAAAAYTDSSSYTSDSWSAFQDALTAAKALSSGQYETEEAAATAQATIDSATYALAKAIANLVEITKLTVYVGESVTKTVTGSLNKTDLDTSIATVTLNAGALTITGVAVGETTFKVGNKIYNVSVKVKPDVVTSEDTPFTSATGVGSGSAVTKLTTSVGLSFDIDVDTTKAASGGTWSIADTSIATVNANGVVSGVGAGETTLTYTAPDGTSYTMPVVIRQDAADSSNVKIYDYYISEVTDTTTYMSVSMSTDLVEVIEGEAVYISVGKTDDTAVDFFGAPNEGYALTRMSSTNSAGDYMALSGEPSETDFCTKSGAAGSNQINTFGSEKVYPMVAAAQALKCDGGMGWTRPSSNTNGVTSTLTFRSEKLPTVTKEVSTVNGVAYTEGMNAKVGDVIVFKVTVQKYESEDEITYSDASLKDKLSGAVFQGSTSATKSITIPSTTAADTQTFNVTYTVTDADLDSTIENTVDLTYTYKAKYSSGSYDTVANASAKVNAFSFIPKDIVIDFGLPVTMDYSADDAHGRYNLVSGSAIYGKVSVSNNVVTYTPDEVLQGIDTVTLKNEKNAEITFKVYPATTVYYEEGFTSYSEGFTDASKGNGTQNTAILGSDSNNYGYDEAYKGTVTKTVAISSAVGDSQTFTFTGTGADIYADCKADSGVVFITVRNAAGSVVKFANVNTAKISGESIYTNYEDITTVQNAPIYSIMNLAHGTYSVQIKHVSSANTVYIDGFRVYNTLADSNVFKDDLEDNPSFIEARDLNYFAFDLDSYDGKYASYLSEQIYQKLSEETENITAVVTATGYGDATKDIIDNGPKNEIYLYPGMSLSLNIRTEREVQLGLRGLENALTCWLNGTNTVVSTTDMFYTAKAKGGYENVVISNPKSSTGILAVTKIKVCDDPGVIAPVTESNVMDTLYALGYEDPSTDLTITQQPTSVTAKVKEKVSFSVVAENAASYQWYYTKNGKTWYKSTGSGATTDTLTITASATNEANQYRCKITGIDGTVQYTDTVKVTVLKAVKITSQPVSVSAQIGDKVSFSVTAENAVSYQWYYSKDGGKKWYKTTATGATTESISLKASSSNINNIYRCKITGQDGKAVYTNAVGMKG